MGGAGLSDRGVSFVIRLWLESDRDRVPPEWRWTALHVQSRHERHGRRFNDLMAFVEQESGAPPPSGPRRTPRGSRASAPKSGIGRRARE